MFLLLVTLAAGLAGGGLMMIVRGVIGPSVELRDIVDDLHRPRLPGDATPRSGFDRLLDTAVGRSAARNRADLDICERSKQKFAQDRATWAILGSSAGVVAFILSAGGVFGVAPALALLAAIVGAVAGWFYAVIDLRSDAVKRRREFRHALAAYLELVTILMAGGAGVQSAMYDAAAIGRGSSFRHMKSALSQSQARRENPWTTLGALGTRLGLDDLVEFESSMTLAGDGARVRDSLRAKAESMRNRDRAEQESEAESRSESMVLPVAMMFAGFLLLLGYPALQGLSTP